MDIGSKPELDVELCDEVMKERREQCEQGLREMFDKQGIPEEEGFAIANSVLSYFRKELNEAHGAERNDKTKTAVDKLRMAAGYIALEKIAKMSMETDTDKMGDSNGQHDEQSAKESC